MKKLILASAISATLLAGCGGSSSNDNDTVNPEPTSAQFSLGISDAPVSNVKEVWVAFDSITLKNNAEEYAFTTRDTSNPDQPVMINLLDYTGSDIYSLLDDETVSPGSYQWLRANIINGDMANIEMTSHLVYNDDTIVPLEVNRKSNDGLGEIQINDINLAVGDNDFVLEFDLKKSLVNPSNSEDVVLKPNGIRLENLAEVQDIEGTVSEELFMACETDNMDIVPETGDFGHAVYLYSVAEGQKDLYVDGETVPADAPIATANVVMNEDSSNYEFEIGFIATGEYTLGYTCAAHIDDPEVMDELFTLESIEPVSVVAGEDSVVTFDIAAAE